jgi:putative flippase GtrA
MAAASSALALLDRVTGGRSEQLVRYGSVSVIGVVFTQSELVLFHGVLDINATLSNLIAVMLSAGPAFLLNKRWVWNLKGRSSFRREIAPFWAFTLLGLVVSTILVAIVDHYTDRTWPVLAANITGFGLVWISKFLFLDSVVFAALADAEAEAAALDGQ